MFYFKYMPKLGQRGTAHLLVPLILLIGLIAGVYLVTSGNPLKLFSRATNPPIVFKSLDGRALPLNNGVYQATSPDVSVEVTSTLGPPPSLSGPIGKGTVSYRAGFSPAEVHASAYLPYTTEPTTYNLTIKDTTEIQYYWVEFKGVDSKLDRRVAKIQLTSAPTPTPTPDNSWTMYKKNPAHTANSTNKITPTPTLAWSNTASISSFVRGFCVVGGDSLFCGDNVTILGGYCGVGGGSFRAFSVSTGALIWEDSCTKSMNIRRFTGNTTPVYSNGTIYWGDGEGNVTAAKGTDGQIIWQTNIGAAITGDMIISGTTIYAVGANGLFALDSNSGKVLWLFNINIAGSTFRASPALANHTVYLAVGVSGVGGYVFALNAQTGAQIWQSAKIAGGYNITSAPTYFNKNIYFGVSSDWLGGIFYSGIFYKLDAGSGNIVWSKPVEGPINYSSPAVTNNNLLVVGVDTTAPQLVAFDENGNQVWKTTMETYGNQISSPAAIGNYIAITTYSGRVKLLDQSNGSIVWDSGRLDPNGANTSPIWDGTRLYAGTQNGDIFSWTLPIEN